MNDNDAIAGTVMASVVSLLNEDGQSIAERMSVADLWIVIQHTVHIVRNEAHPDRLTATELKVWHSAAVLTALRNGQKIMAIKEARAITGMGLRDAKELVERMEAAGLTK